MRWSSRFLGPVAIFFRARFVGELCAIEPISIRSWTEIRTFEILVSNQSLSRELPHWWGKVFDRPFFSTCLGIQTNGPLLFRGCGFLSRSEQIPAVGRLCEDTLQILRQQVSGIDQVLHGMVY